MSGRNLLTFVFIVGILLGVSVIVMLRAGLGGWRTAIPYALIAIFSGGIFVKRRVKPLARRFNVLFAATALGNLIVFIYVAVVANPRILQAPASHLFTSIGLMLGV